MRLPPAREPAAIERATQVGALVRLAEVVHALPPPVGAPEHVDPPPAVRRIRVERTQVSGNARNPYSLRVRNPYSSRESQRELSLGPVLCRSY